MTQDKMRLKFSTSPQTLSPEDHAKSILQRSPSPVLQVFEPESSTPKIVLIDGMNYRACTGGGSCPGSPKLSTGKKQFWFKPITQSHSSESLLQKRHQNSAFNKWEPENYSGSLDSLDLDKNGKVNLSKGKQTTRPKDFHPQDQQRHIRHRSESPHSKTRNNDTSLSPDSITTNWLSRSRSKKSKSGKDDELSTSPKNSSPKYWFRSLSPSPRSRSSSPNPESKG